MNGELGELHCVHRIGAVDLAALALGSAATHAVSITIGRTAPTSDRALERRAYPVDR